MILPFSVLGLLLFTALTAALPGSTPFFPSADRPPSSPDASPPRAVPPPLLPPPGTSPDFNAPTRYTCSAQTAPYSPSTVPDCERALFWMFSSLTAHERPPNALIAWTAGSTRAQLDAAGRFDTEALPREWREGTCVVSVTQAGEQPQTQAHRASALAMRIAGWDVLRYCISGRYTSGVAAIAGIGAEGLMMTVGMTPEAINWP